MADVSEAVRQYADALMLSGESAIGSYGHKALSVLQMTSSRMELWSREENCQPLFDQCQLGESLADRISEQICNCAVEMGQFCSTFIDHLNLQLSETTYVVIYFNFTSK